jgi:hypothetical protein
VDFNTEPDFEPAPQALRDLFTGQALSHFDEMVLSWRMGGHPIAWTQYAAIFQVNLENGPVMMFQVQAPNTSYPARVEVDPNDAAKNGIPLDLAQALWNELAFIGKVVENSHAPIYVPLSKFSRGDRKVFLAYALTIARTIACWPS